MPDDDWHPNPCPADALWEAARAEARRRGWALDWNGTTYAIWRPGWTYVFPATWFELAALLSVPAAVAAPAPPVVVVQLNLFEERKAA